MENSTTSSWVLKHRVISSCWVHGASNKDAPWKDSATRGHWYSCLLWLLRWGGSFSRPGQRNDTAPWRYPEDTLTCIQKSECFRALSGSSYYIAHPKGIDVPKPVVFPILWESFPYAWWGKHAERETGTHLSFCPLSKMHLGKADSGMGNHHWLKSSL